MWPKTAWNKGITRYVPKPCLCGCGEYVKLHVYPKKDGGAGYSVNRFIKAHAKRGVGGFDFQKHTAQKCLCGCGSYTKKARNRDFYWRYIKGHENIGRVAWNKGKSFSIESRRKMSLARLGKEPANKAKIDERKLLDLYLKERKNISEVSKMLGVSVDSIKNRLQALGLSRSTKESCASPIFREKMRAIRIKALTSGKAIASPNKLEKLVYDALDFKGVTYERQKPIMNKFVVDAYFPQKQLILEIFGKYWHELPEINKKDYAKKKYLEKCGYKVEELWDYEIKQKGVNQALEEIFTRHQIAV